MIVYGMEQSLVSFKYHIALALDVNVNVYTCTNNSTLDQFPGFEIREGKLFGHFITRIFLREPRLLLFSRRRPTRMPGLSQICSLLSSRDSAMNPYLPPSAFSRKVSSSSHFVWTPCCFSKGSLHDSISFISPSGKN